MALVLAVATAAVGGPGAGADTVRLPLALRVGEIQTSAATNLLNDPSIDLDPDAHYVIQLRGPVTPAWRASLESIGLSFGDYIPSYAYVVAVPSGAGPVLAALPFVNWLGAIPPDWKIAPEVADLLPRDPSDDGEEDALLPVRLVVTLFHGKHAAEAITVLLESGGSEITARHIRDQWYIAVKVPLDGIQDVAEAKCVQLVELAPQTVPRNDTNAWIVQSNVESETPVWDAGILGQNQMAGLIDSGPYLDHCAFADASPIGAWHRKFAAIRGPAVPDMHGTNVASTLAGDAEVIGEPDGYDGMAPLARISFTDFALIQSEPLAVFDYLLAAHDDGARAHNNSWGDDVSDEAYNTLCRLVDLFSYELEDSLVLFAATNQDPLRTPENAKNVLAVAASKDTPHQDEHARGARGPTLDGRRKPEILAPGLGTLCAAIGEGTCHFDQATGTSMACAAITGGALLARQYLVDGYYPVAGSERQPFLPSGALVKAMLLNGAVDMTAVPPQGPEYPSDQEGWGRLLLDNVLEFEGDTRRLWVYDRRNADGIETGESWEWPLVQVMSDAVPFRVTLVFTEPPGSAFNSDPVVNNLDLEVVGPGGLYRGNAFENGQSVAGGEPDARNNVEQVYLINPVPGTYAVTVRGTAVNEGRQGFAIVITGDFDTEFVLEDWPDCNHNGIRDTLDIADGRSADCQPNGIPDECERLDDCDGSGVPDVCESMPDCNSNGIPDPCELELDCDGDGIPDDCQDVPDCNYNRIPDTCDALAGFDCQPDGTPDVCQIPLDTRQYEGPGEAPIPDGSPSGVSRTLMVDEYYTVWDVDVGLDIRHSYNGDLTVQLVHEGVTAVLVERPGHPVPWPMWGFGDPGYEDLILDDWSYESVETTTTDGMGPVSGVLRPYPDPLNTFAGLDAYGPWTLQVIDDVAGASGTLEEWFVRIAEATGPPDGCSYYGDCTSDGCVNLNDYPYLANCLSGPGGPIPPECACADIDTDGDVDLQDYSLFGVYVRPASGGARGDDKEPGLVISSRR